MRVACSVLVFFALLRIARADVSTEVVVLGVSHAGQLVSESAQPATLRAFIDRARPAAICIERQPASYARGEFYEFTYEQQEIVVPHARERGIPIWPVDWEPDADDVKLAFGVDLGEPPLLRPATGYQSFVSFPAASALTSGLFAAESRDFDPDSQRWIQTPAKKPRHDFPRRLFLYRTFLQAMRIARVARRYPGRRVLVVVGWMHKRDIEEILRDEPGVKLVAPTRIGAPRAGQVAAAIRDKDLEDVLTFNLLGVQGSTGNVNWAWMRQTLATLRARRPGAAPLALFEIRLAVLTGAIDSAAAEARYDRAAAALKGGSAIAWTGRNDLRRLDSFFDPFAGLSLEQRLRLERARELGKLGRTAEVTRLRDELASQLAPLQAIQLRAYWDEFVSRRK